MNDLEGVSIQMKDQKKPSDDHPDQARGKGKNADNKIPSANEFKEEMKDIQGNLKKGIPQNVGASIVSLGDKDMAAWKIISDVPYVPTPWSYLCLVLNLIQIVLSEWDLVLTERDRGFRREAGLISRTARSKAT